MGRVEWSENDEGKGERERKLCVLIVSGCEGLADPLLFFYFLFFFLVGFARGTKTTNNFSVDTHTPMFTLSPH